MLGEKEWRDHATLVGAVTLGWNRCVHRLLDVFTHLTGVESPLADVIFFSAQSDSSQRRMLRGVAKTVDMTDDDRNILFRLLDRLDKASTGRNLAAHVIFGVTAFDKRTGAWGPKVVPLLDPVQDRRLHDDFEAQFRRVETELAAISVALEQWLISTPYPTRTWTGPPLPLAAAADLERAFARSQFETEQTFGGPSEDEFAG